MTIVAIILLTTGCGTPKEKTAPCKRPANVTSYAEDPRVKCGPMRLVNPDRRAALAAINDLTGQAE
ncbi:MULTISPECIES: hypothetical protein [unclassified Mesorhizobium]|uniref:hypothetical protein n=1 Tax=unclassified Mesorhizobium TaxID=325217 RepID=UPI001671E6C7|nr:MULTISPECIES: hypothetical protein [unclassified Mesorhizobium]